MFCFPFAYSRWNKEKKEGGVTVIYSETKLYQWEFPRSAGLGCHDHSVWPASSIYLWGRRHAAPTTPGKQGWRYSYHTPRRQCQAGCRVLVLQHPGDFGVPPPHTLLISSGPISDVERVRSEGFVQATQLSLKVSLSGDQHRTRNRRRRSAP